MNQHLFWIIWPSCVWEIVLCCDYFCCLVEFDSLISTDRRYCCSQAECVHFHTLLLSDQRELLRGVENTTLICNVACCENRPHDIPQAFYECCSSDQCAFLSHIGNFHAKEMIFIMNEKFNERRKIANETDFGISEYSTNIPHIVPTATELSWTSISPNSMRFIIVSIMVSVVVSVAIIFHFYQKLKARAYERNRLRENSIICPENYPLAPTISVSTPVPPLENNDEKSLK